MLARNRETWGEQMSKAIDASKDLSTQLPQLFCNQGFHIEFHDFINDLALHIADALRATLLDHGGARTRALERTR